MLIVVAIALIALGALIDVMALMAVGAVAFAFLPPLLLAPAFRIASARPAKPGYSNATWVGGALTVLGFKPSEQGESGREDRTTVRSSRAGASWRRRD